MTGQVLRPETGAPLPVETMKREQIAGVLFENERLAAEWLAAAAHLGLHSPADFGFALLSGPIFGAELPVGWAHYRIPRQEMGRQAVRLSQEILQQKPALSPVDLPCEWITGSSLGRGSG